MSSHLFHVGVEMEYFLISMHKCTYINIKHLNTDDTLKNYLW